MTVTPPADGNRDSYRENHGLDEAKKRLSEIRGRPFEVDKVLAAHDVREQRNIQVRQEAKNKIKEVRAKALQRQHEMRAAQILKESQTMLKKELDLEEINLRFAKKLEEKKMKDDRKDSSGGDKNAPR